jgi:hypothetical protein
MYTYMPPRRQEQAIIRRFGCFPPGKDALYSMDISAGYMIMEHAPPRFSSGLVSGFEGAGSVNRVLAFFRLATLASYKGLQLAGRFVAVKDGIITDSS